MAQRRKRAQGRPSRRREEQQPHDESYKRFFSNPIMVRHLIEGFIPGKWLDQLDFASLEPVPTSFVSDITQQRHCDVIWRIRSRDGGDWTYIYVLIEFQSQPDSFMVIRLMAYMGLIWEALSRLPEYRRKDTRLPAILPIVLYNGDKRWTQPLSLSEIVEPLPEELDHLQPTLRYLLVDEGTFVPKQLASMRNLVATLFRLENSRTPIDTEAGLLALNERLEQDGTAEVERAFDLWLEQILKPRFPEIDVGEIRSGEGKTMLAQRIDEWIGKARRDGIQEGRQEGRLEGVRALQDLVINLLERRFQALSSSHRGRIRAMTSISGLSELAAKANEVDALDALGLD